MRFALYSDLHLELPHDPWELPPLDVDMVILAGDIGKHTHGLAWAANVFRHASMPPQIVYVAGNHEYYDAHLGMLAELRRPQWKIAGISFLECDTLLLPGLRVLGCTLWSGFDLNGTDRLSEHMSYAKLGINDYWLIHAAGGKALQPSDTRKLHQKAVRWLDSELAQPFDGKTVVVTHFAPHRGCVAPRHQGSDLSPYFVSDLTWLMKKHRIDMWCHGHTHTNNDFIAENGCRVVSNQRGYPYEAAAGNTGFRPDLVIEV